MDEKKFVELFQKAVDAVDKIYYGKSGWDEIDDNLSEIEDEARLELLRKFLSRYGERPFCYELYHQIRLQMEDYFKSHPDEKDTRICLHAEIQKKQIRESLPYLQKIQNLDSSSEIEPLDKEYVPDFLLHDPKPASFERQLVVVEVKSDPRLSFSRFKDDLLKIQEFIEGYNFRQGIFLTVNTSAKKMRENLLKNLNWIETEIPNRSQIVFMCKEGHDVDLIKYNLA